MWTLFDLSARGYVPMFTGRLDRFGIPISSSPYPEHRDWLKKKSGPVFLFVIFALRSLEASQLLETFNRRETVGG
jgi:hypothetical protein